MKRRIAAALVPMAMLAVVLTPAAHATSRFDGSCQLKGELSFERPLGNLPAETAYRDRLSGTCTGHLNGVAERAAPVVLSGGGRGTLGCLLVRSRGELTLTFTRGTADEADDTSLRFRTETVGTLGQFLNTLRGEVAGSAISHGSLLASSNAQLLADCSAGALRSARYDLYARTLVPLEG